MMSDRQKMMCGCKTCIIFDDIQRCINLFQKQYIVSLKKDVEEMPVGETRVNASTDLQQYIQSVCNDPLGKVTKHDIG
jgi:hypothetical protein